MTGPPGEIHADPDGGRTLVLRREYPDPPEDVWAAITESDRLARWIGTWSGTPQVGGTVAFTMTGEVDAGGDVADPMDLTIVECEPPRRLVVEFPGGGPVWRLDLTVEPAGSGAVLVFAQRRIDDATAADMEAGWRWYLDRLTASLHGEAMPAWDDYAPTG